VIALAIFAALQVADVTLTTLILRMGGQELNPAMRWLMDKLGTVSGGQSDPGGVSYGTYQLASKTGTAAAFVANEGRRWAALLPGVPGSAEFSAGWRDVAQREPEAFGEAQHAAGRGGQHHPGGRHTVSRVNPDGSFHVGGNTAVWPRRVVKET